MTLCHPVPSLSAMRWCCSVLQCVAVRCSVLPRRVTSHLSTGHFTLFNESCRTSVSTRARGSAHTHQYSPERERERGRETERERERERTKESERGAIYYPLLAMSHVTPLNESLYTSQWIMSHFSALTLQRTATHCNTLQHTATHCNATNFSFHVQLS